MTQVLLAMSEEEFVAAVRKAVRDELAGAPAQVAKRYVDVAELATHFGVSRATIRNWIGEGLPVLRRGKLLRFELEVAELWIRGRAGAHLACVK